MLCGDVFNRKKLIDAGIVHEDIEMPVGFFSFGEEAGNVGFLGDIRLDGDSLAALGGDLVDDLVRAGLAGGVVDDNRSALGRQMFRNGRADAFGCAGDYRDLAREFLCVIAHMFGSFLVLVLLLICCLISNS
jgi:hypothetical protein